MIIQNNQLRNKYKGFQRSIKDITEITVHGSGGGNSSLDLINWMASEGCERKDFYLKGIGLFPFTIDFSGKVYQIMPVNDWYYHSDAGIHDSHTIGIEMMNNKPLNAGGYTDAQYQSLFELIAELIKSYPITDIHSHDANRRMFSNMASKPCPGAFFDWNNLEQYVTDNINKTMMIIRG
jgi:hypothetical protein